MNRLSAPLARRFLGPFLALSATVGGGTLGYIAIEGWSLNDAFYMTMITIGTVGFGEVRPLSTTGRNFTALLRAGQLLAPPPDAPRDRRHRRPTPRPGTRLRGHSVS